jgi:hypothetical protein
MKKSRRGGKFNLELSLKEIAWETHTQIGNNSKMTVTKTLGGNHKRIELIQDKTELKLLITTSKLRIL